MADYKLKTYICPVANSFSAQIVYNKKTMLVVVVPQFRQDGMHYEINIKGYPRFFMAWSPLGRYDVIDEDMSLPYDLVLLVSDALEQNTIKRR